MPQLIAALLWTLLIFETNAARILCVFPTPSFSHQVVYRTLTQELARRGHRVVVVTTHPAFPPGESPANLTEIDTYDVSHHIWLDGISKVYNEVSSEMNVTGIYMTMFTEIFERQIQFKPVQELIKKGKGTFDLLILESNILSTLGLAHVFDVPVIQTSSFGPMPETYSKFGTPGHPLLYPTAVLQQRFYNLTIWESILNLYKNFVTRYTISRHQDVDNEMLQRSLESDVPPINELYKRVSVFFQTVYPIWMNNPPVPPGIVYLGGLHQKQANNLPQDLQKFLDSSMNGVIYVSFGSNVHPSLLSPEKIEMMAKVFSKLPYDILWKRDKIVQSKTATNIKIYTWLPQSDLLYHPKIKLFITQGGLQSTEESITAGVPLIGIPMLGDQWMQTENYVRHRIGLKLDWLTLTAEELTRSIATVLEDKNYKENVLRLRNIMNDRPQSAVEHMASWTEYVLRHGGAPHLLPDSAHLPWAQYYEIELIFIVLLFGLSVASIAIFIVFRLTSVCYKEMYKRKNKCNVKKSLD